MRGIFGGLLPLLVLGAIVAGIVKMVRHRETITASDPEEGSRGLRRFFVYTILLAALIISAIGVSAALGGVMPGRTRPIDWRSSDAALALAFTVIGIPVWALVWRYVRRNLEGDPRERRSPMWSLYVGAALTISLMVAGFAVAWSLRWAFGGEAASEQLAAAIVWGAVWAGHWWMLRHPVIRPEKLRTEILLVGSLWGLVAGMVGAGILAGGVAREVYERLTDVTRVSQLDALRNGGGWAISGGLAWVWYWWRHARTEKRTTTWHSYVLIPGVLGGLATMLAAAGVIIYPALEWWWGNPPTVEAARQYNGLPDALVAGLLGLAVWGYHRAALGTGPETLKTEPGRAYRYLLSGAGLVSATVGIGMIVNALLDAADTRLTGAGGSINIVLLGATLMAVGTPVWFWTWRRIQRSTAADPGIEIPSPSRRIYLVALFGVGSVVALVTLIIIVYQVFRVVLGDLEAGDLIANIRVPAGLLVATAGVSAYHLAVWLDDRRRAPAPTGAVAVRDVILVTPDGVGLVEAIHTRTGARVHLLHPTGLVHATATPDDVATAVAGVQSRRVLVVAEEDGELLVLGYED